MFADCCHDEEILLHARGEGLTWYTTHPYLFPHRADVNSPSLLTASVSNQPWLDVLLPRSSVPSWWRAGRVLCERLPSDREARVACPYWLVLMNFYVSVRKRCGPIVQNRDFSKSENTRGARAHSSRAHSPVYNRRREAAATGVIHGAYRQL